MIPSGGRRSLATRLAWAAHVARRAPSEARFPFRDAGVIRAAQQRRLRDTVAHAFAHVPFYREAMRALGLAPQDIATVADLARLPLVDREQLQADPERFVSDAEPLDAYVMMRSGGSTGDPVSILHHPFSLFEQAVYSERRRMVISQLAGRRRYREARIAGVPKSYAGGQHLASTFKKLSVIPPSIRVQRREWSVLTPLDQLVGELDAFGPDVIASFGSLQEMLFTHLLRSGRPMRLPKVAVYAGDAMSPQARALAQHEFGVHVLSTYTATEAFQIGFECERHSGHHLNEDLFPIRIVRPDGEEARAGASGDVVVSNLQARGTVLLNYRLNDVAARLPEPCTCGRTLPLLSLVQGRSDEWLEGEDGRRIHSQAVRIFLQDELEILRFQVAQTARAQFRIALVTVPGAGEAPLRARLECRFREVFGEGTRLELRFVDSLPRSAAGKARPVVSLQGLERAREAGVLAGLPAE